MKGSKRQEYCCKHGSGAGGLLWLMLPLVLFVVLKTDILLQLAHFDRTSFTHLADQIANKVSSLGLESAKWKQQQPFEDESKSEATRDRTQKSQMLATNGPKDSSSINSDVPQPPMITSSKVTCDFSSRHSDICEMEGDVRIHGKSAMVYVVSSSTYRPENATIRLQPYTRKWERGTMSRIREFAVRSTPPPAGSGANAGDTIVPPQCTVRYDVPAVVFSTGGCGTNFFHAMSDVVVPLYATAREYGGRVQLLVADYNAAWVAKHRAVLAALSFYPVVDLNDDAVVRCFPAARVGLVAHRILGIDPARSRTGLTMTGFNEFLRSVFALPRPLPTPASRSRSQTRPRLVMVLRHHSRSLTNEADAMAALAELGFEVIAARPDDVRDVARFAAVVNSCDVMVGVHGAGLTNMVFLPRNATLVQIIPWGAMKWACWYDFGHPATDMGLRYVEYEVTANETTLRERYPMDHPVFADPLSIHKKREVWKYFLEGQNVTLDIPRFKEAMHQVYLSVTTE